MRLCGTDPCFDPCLYYTYAVTHYASDSDSLHVYPDSFYSNQENMCVDYEELGKTPYIKFGVYLSILEL